MTHPGQYNHNGYLGRSEKESDAILNALIALETASGSNKSLTVKGSNGSIYHFDARKTIQDGGLHI